MTSAAEPDDQPPLTETIAAALAAGIGAAAAIDLLTLRAAYTLEKLQDSLTEWLIKTLMRELLRPTDHPEDVWEERVRRLLPQAQRRIMRDKHTWALVDQTLTGTGRDLAEALAGLLNNDDALRPARQALAHLANAWRFGINGMTRDVQDRLVATTWKLRDGYYTLPQAVHEAARDILKEDVKSFRDSLGRRWQPATYSEMSIRTASMSAHTTATLNAARDLGSNFVMVSDTHRECPKCAVFERKILAITPPATDPAFTTFDDARARGLQHPGCRHGVYMWHPDYDNPPPPGEPDPQGYAASQEQRRLERLVRRTKIEVDIDRTTGAETPATAAARARKLAQAQQKLRDHVTAHPELKRARWREQPRPGDQW